jgi:hypothetical protein
VPERSDSWADAGAVAAAAAIAPGQRGACAGLAPLLIFLGAQLATRHRSCLEVQHGRHGLARAAGGGAGAGTGGSGFKLPMPATRRRRRPCLEHQLDAWNGKGRRRIAGGERAERVGVVNRCREAPCGTLTQLAAPSM